MGELHSLQYSPLHSSNTVGWDFHNLGVLNADTMSLRTVMDGNAPLFPPTEPDFSTGYLEDALVESREMSKRRRLLLDATDQYQSNYRMRYWNSNDTWGLAENLSCMNQMYNMNGSNSDEPMGSSISRSMSSTEEVNIVSETKTSEEDPDSLSSSYSKLDPADSKFVSGKEPLFTLSPMLTSSGDHGKKKKKRVIRRVVYPFAFVKPGGIEGDMTINDINERILMPPTRPVRHPVGDFACRPCISPDGPGISGKAVVALTRIHTQGRGTITIIRTKG